MKPATYEQFDAITRLHFAIFLKRVFAELNPSTEYLDNFHIHVLIDELEDLRFGRRRRLAVAMPPRSLKSLLISVAYVAWLLGHDPTLRIICASYGQELADKLASDCRQVMQSDWYKRMFPRTRLAPKRQLLSNFETTAGGGRFSTSVGGVLTGFGADFIIVDDPSKPSESLSDAERVTINNWIQHTLFTRLNDKRHGRIVIVMQRLHEDDVIGNVVEKTHGDFKVLAFSAIAQVEEAHAHKTAFGVARVFRKVGEALHAAREPLEVLEEQRQLLGSSFFSSQYLQTPVPLEGGMVKRAWLRTYQPFEVMNPERIVQSWDTAAKLGEYNDYSVCTTWAIIRRRIPRRTRGGSKQSDQSGPVKHPPHLQSGGRITNRAARAPQREQRQRARTSAKLPAPPAFTTIWPDIVVAMPQSLHSTLRLAPNRTRSAAVRTCLVDIQRA